MVGTIAGTGEPNSRAEKPEPDKALAMLDAFASVGATAFDVTLTNIEGEKQGYQSIRGVDELRG